MPRPKVPDQPMFERLFCASCGSTSDSAGAVPLREAIRRVVEDLGDTFVSCPRVGRHGAQVHLRREQEGSAAYYTYEAKVDPELKERAEIDDAIYDALVEKMYGATSGRRRDPWR